MAHFHPHTSGLHAPCPHESGHSRLMRLAGYASVSMACTLVAAKLAVWWMSGSLAILSSLTDSLFDVLVSVMNLIALRYALKPADHEHRFGHTAIEDIVGLGQCVFILASMMLIILQSLQRLVDPVPLTHEMLGIYVSLFGMATTLALVMFQGYVARRTGSLIIAADRLHYLGDIAFNAGVILALAGSAYFAVSWLDPLVAIAIALSVIISTVPLGRRAFHNLMGHEMPFAQTSQMLDQVQQIEGVRGIHRLRTRYMGNKPIIQLHIEIDAHHSFASAHQITDAAEAAILTLWPHAEVMVHADPVTY